MADQTRTPGYTQDDLDWIISVDDHVLEPPHVWQDRLPARYRDIGPRIETHDGVETWAYEDLRKPTEGLAAAAGKDKTEFTPASMRYTDMRPGCFDPSARVEDMTLDGVISSLCFPSFPRFCGQVFLEATDKDLALLCVQAYNDWMIDEWCGSQPGRLIPLTLVPLWGPALAAREIERCAAKGARGFAFSENPAQLGLPSLYDKGHHWDPMLAAASDTGMVVCTHIGSSSQLPKTAPDCPLITSVVLTPLNAMNNLVDWLVSGQFLRHPGLKLALSEGGIGWIPPVLERTAYTLDRHKHWAAQGDFTLHGANVAGTVPEGLLEADVYQLFRDHVFGCFIDDEFGVANLDAIGIDNVMAESDYPHTDSTWPHTLSTIKERLKHRSDDDTYKIMQGNARRVFDWTPAAYPARSH